MAWSLDSDRPVYVQLAERLKLQIVSGYYSCGDRLPSVRELAAAAAVNPNTMQRAFAELERSGLVVTLRTSGRVVTEDRALVEELRHDMAKLQVKTFVDRMAEIGCSRDEVLELLREVLEQESANL